MKNREELRGAAQPKKVHTVDGARTLVDLAHHSCYGNTPRLRAAKHDWGRDAPDKRDSSWLAKRLVKAVRKVVLDQVLLLC